MKLADQTIGINCRPFVVAEMSGNHNQLLDQAIQLVEIAHRCGVDAIKLQTYTPNTMTLDLDEKEFIIKNDKNIWQGNSLYSLYRKAHTPWEWHKPIFDRAKELDLIIFSTPFDETAVDFLETLDTPFYKIASFEIVDIPLIRKIAATGKPMIISTGMATLSEIDDAVYEARKYGAKDIILLKCTSNYPSSPENTNLLTIPHMRQLFECEVGISDHTLGIGVAVASVAVGATVIEKHFTLNRNNQSVDAKFSLEPDELKLLVAETERAWKSLGRIKYGPIESEMNSRMRRRSLYITKSLQKGEIFTRDNVRSIRPGHGLLPKYLDIIVGKRASRDILLGTPLSWDLIE